MTDPAPPDSVVTWTAEGPAFVVRLANRVTDLLGSPDGQEGLAAFIAKRPASFA